MIHSSSRTLDIVAVVVGLAFAAAVIVALLHELATQRDQVLTLTRGEAQDHARIHALHASRGLMLVESALADVAANTATGPITEDRPLTLHLAVKHKSLYLPQALNVRVFDEGGKLIADGNEYPAPEASVADEPFFRQHRDQWAGFLFQKPWRLGGTGSYTFGLSRRISEDGRFIGVVQALIDPTYFTSLHPDRDAELVETAVLFDAEGTVLASWPAGQGVDITGQPVWTHPKFGAIPKQGLAGRGRQTLGDDREIVSIFQLSDYPFRVAVASNGTAALQDWRGKAKNMGVLVVGIALAASGMAAHVLRRIVRAMREKDRTTG